MGVRVPSGPRFGVDGAFEGYVRLPFTVAGAVADEAAARLAAAARLVETGVTAGTEAPRTFVALTGGGLRGVGGRRSASAGTGVVAGRGRALAAGPRPVGQRLGKGSTGSAGVVSGSATGSSAAAAAVVLRRRSSGGSPRGSSASTAWRWASLVASSYGSGVAGTWSRWTGPVPSRA